jgi:hypothetical protein
VFDVGPVFGVAAAAITRPIATFEVARLHPGKEGATPVAEGELIEVANENFNHFWVGKVWSNFSAQLRTTG